MAGRVICPFCRSINRVPANTCWKCNRVLFSTEYETKRVKRLFGIRNTLLTLIVISAYPAWSYLSPLVLAKLHPTNISGQAISTISSPTLVQVDTPIPTVKKETTVVLHFPNGDAFEGTVVNNVKEGFGKYKWANGNVYQGDFLHDVIQGEGVFIFCRWVGVERTIPKWSL
jgi:hypothetical protein